MARDWRFNSRLVRNRKSICQKSLPNKISCHLEFVTSLVTLVINLLIQICSTFDVQEEYLKGRLQYRLQVTPPCPD